MTSPPPTLQYILLYDTTMVIDDITGQAEETKRK